MDKTEKLKHYNSIKANAVNAFNQNELDKALNYIHTASSIAWNHHIGLWYDDELENLLFKIGNALRNDVSSNEDNRDIKRSAYITTIMEDIGGNPEVLRQWAKLLKHDFGKQTLYITYSNVFYTSIDYSEQLLDDTKLDIKELSFRDSFIERTKNLIKLLENNSYDCIFLFIEPSDVVAITAIHALNKKPKIIFFNHAEQSFWLGRNIIDYLIDQREEGAGYSKKYRHINNSYIVPLPTDIKLKKHSKGRKDGSTISLSIGSFFKVLGDHQINYFNVIFKLLKQFPDHYHIFITNPPSNDILEKYLPNDPIFNERFIIDGPYTDLSPYYGMADFLIETFPISGGLVRLEAMACKLPVVAFNNKKFPLFTGQSKLPSNYSFEGSTEEEILDYSSKLIKDPEIRVKEGKNLYNYYLNELSLEKIHEILCSIIKDTQNPSTLEDKKYIPDYDLDYAGIYQSDAEFEPYKKLLLLSILKKSSFSFIERGNFYLKSLKNNEFKSKKLTHAFLSIIGWNGLSILIDKNIVKRKTNLNQFKHADLS